MLHILNAATGEDLQPAFMFHVGKGWALNLVDNVLWMANTYAGRVGRPRSSSTIRSTRS